MRQLRDHSLELEGPPVRPLLPPPQHEDGTGGHRSGHGAPPHGARGRWIVGLAALAVLVAALLWGGWQHYRTRQQVMNTAQQKRDYVPTVRVAEVRPSPSSTPLVLPGTTEAFQDAPIFSRATGYVLKRFVDIGSPVKAGQLLALVTAPELDKQLDQARAQLVQTQAALRQNRANMQLAGVTNGRTSKLAADGWVSRQQADNDRLTYEASVATVGVGEANVTAQQAEVGRVAQQQAYKQVLAPFDGVITARNVDAGSLVQADSASGTPLFTMSQARVIRVQLYVPQDAAFGIHRGVTADVTIPEMPEQKFRGTVTRTADSLQAGTRTLQTEIDIDNTDGRLQPGIYCMVTLEVPRKTPSLIIPSDAIIFNRDGMQVAVVGQDDKIQLRKVEVARDLGATMELRDGVKPGERVIVSPPVDLVADQKVQIFKPDSQVQPAGAGSPAGTAQAS